MNPLARNAGYDLAESTFVARIIRHWPRFRKWSLRLVKFGLAQGLVQLLSALAGFLIVRTMSKHDYALYAIANSMQTAGNLLADLGIGIGLRSIGGRVWEDGARFGQLLNTTLALRKRFALISFGVTLPVAGWMLWRNGASFLVLILLTAAIAMTLIPLLSSSVFSAALQLLGEYRRIQKLDFANATLRLALLVGLALTQINAVLAVAVGAVGNWFQIFWQRRWVAERADPSAPPNTSDRLKLLQLSMKALPNGVFFCFQGQITLLILTLFGNSTGIADVTALGRVAMLFTVFSVTFGNVLTPRFARCQDPKRLPRLYLLLVGGTVLVLTPVLLLAWLYPAPLLWLLGEKYAGLEHECLWVVAAGCVTQVGSVMWNLNSSKAWINGIAFAHIPLTLAVQATAACLIDLTSFGGVLVFNLLSASVPLPLYVFDAVRGLNVVMAKCNTRDEY